MTAKKRPPGKRPPPRAERKRPVPQQARSAIDKAIDKAEAAEPAPDTIVVGLPLLKNALSAQLGNVMSIKPKPSEQPSLLVYIPEIGAYQPIFLPPGSSWVLRAEQEGFPRIAVPGGPGWGN